MIINRLIRIKRLFVTILAGGLIFACTNSKNEKLKFNTNVMMLGLGFTAKSYCSCLFVSEGQEPECKEYAALKQVSPRLTADLKEKSATSTLLFIFNRKAQFLSAEQGCALL